MKLLSCAILLCIALVVKGQLHDVYEENSPPQYELLDSQETIKLENGTKHGALDQLYNNISNPSVADVILNRTEKIYADNIELTSRSLNELREQFAYDFDESHYISEIIDPSSMIQMDLGYQLPFFGARYRFANVSLDGAIYFSEKPNEDPALIATLMTKTAIIDLNTNDTEFQKPGVYCRHERDLDKRHDIPSIELRERLKWDIRQGMVGADTFEPRHALIVTWKNVSQAGVVRRFENSHFTNSFQLVLATDEHQTYAIFNYIYITWDGVRDGGPGSSKPSGEPAFVGFNAGNRRQHFNYKPFSQTTYGISDLKRKGGTNGFPGRHIFRIDEEIALGTCSSDVATSNISMVFAPQSGNMMGGTMVNVTGPCFHQNVLVLCRFDKTVVRARILDRNRAVCVQPMLYVQGWVSFDVAIGYGEYFNQGWYYVESPSTAEKTITFPTDQFFQKFDYGKWGTIPIQWNQFDISSNRNENITISLWGYVKPRKLVHIAVIDQWNFSGSYEILPFALYQREELKQYIPVGLLRINITNTFDGINTPSIWSKPIPMAWYFGRQWERKYGENWAANICGTLNTMPNAALLDELPACPCTLKEAENDKGFLLPDPDCSDKFNENGPCIRNPGAAKCLRSSQISQYEQQCCYSNYGDLMFSFDEIGGSRPSRSPTIGRKTLTSGAVPSLSTWYDDISPYYMCCVFQDQRSEGCETYRTKQRFSSDCKKYKPPKIAAVYGDPHFLTFDQQNYTFNGLGEFVLVRGHWAGLSFDVQGRFEETKQQPQFWSMGTRMTSIVAKGNSLVVVEVRQRPDDTQWRYRLDVIVNGRKVYFDSPSRQVQHFDEVTLYTPNDVSDQSHIIIMFANGNGVEVQEKDGMMGARVYLTSGLKHTTGLLGNSNGNVKDDFILPSGEVLKIDPMNLREIHENYGIYWRLTDIFDEDLGKSLFFHDTYQGSHRNITFTPIYERDVLATMFNLDSQSVRDAGDQCDDNFECLFDFGTTLNALYARATLLFQNTTNNIVSIFNERPLTCGRLPTAKHGRKSTFDISLGTYVRLTCDIGYYLYGNDYSLCEANGEWSTTDTECRKYYFENDIQHYDTNNYRPSYHQYYTVGHIVVVVLGILLMISGVIVCIIWRRRSLQRHSRLQGKHYEQIEGEYLDDDVVEWEVPSKADKQS